MAGEIQRQNLRKEKMRRERKDYYHLSVAEYLKKGYNDNSAQRLRFKKFLLIFKLGTGER